ncbi:hypothetical protein FA10DRAFT_246385, partial [Acaromyces ingoldii]
MIPFPTRQTQKEHSQPIFLLRHLVAVDNRRFQACEAVASEIGRVITCRDCPISVNAECLRNDHLSRETVCTPIKLCSMQNQPAVRDSLLARVEPSPIKLDPPKSLQLRLRRHDELRLCSDERRHSDD